MSDEVQVSTQRTDEHMPSAMGFEVGIVASIDTLKFGNCTQPNQNNLLSIIGIEMSLSRGNSMGPLRMSHIQMSQVHMSHLRMSHLHMSHM